MAVAGKTRNFLEGPGSFKWLLGKRTYFDEEFEEIRDSPSAGRNWIMELSPVANIVVRTCSKTLGISLMDDKTASASEIVASTLDDNCRAALVGQRTYGKGPIYEVLWPL
ncbi:hypothetical protein K1719_037881 [Acacia pycnantha]|nr:hypothetical protein K1719_037881 [Acacia pycnantha]